MQLTRSQFLVAAAAGVLSGCTEAVRHAAPPTLPDRLESGPADLFAWRVLSRASFGARPGEVARVAAMGADAFLEEQLAASGDEGLACRLRLGLLDTLQLEADDARDHETATYPEVGKGQAAVELQQAALIRAVYSERQLQEVMVDFWSNHFNVSQLKGECSWLKTVDDRLIRSHALGRFRDLLFASARSPAMLFYLDNEKNRKRDPDTGAGANENYARELLELHTLGVDGGYTLRDIQEVARCLSGWGFQRGFTWHPGEFVFHPGQHDDEPKRVLGVNLPAGQGVRDGEQVIDLLCRHPGTARFLARKLVRRFVSDRPNPRLTARVAETFRRTDGDLRQVLSVLLRSDEFRHGSSRKLRRPLEFATAALRGLAANTTGAGVLPYLERMGQLPFKWPMPDGYPDRAEAWAPGLLSRWSFALDLVQDRIPATSVPLPELARATGATDAAGVLEGLSRLLLGRPLPEPHTRRLLALAPAAGPAAAERLRPWAALLLASPEFQWR